MTEIEKKVLTGRYAGLRMVTPKTIYQTVMNDGSTYVWFSKLVFQDGVVKDLESRSVDVRRLHRAYQIYTAMVVVLFLISALGWAGVAVFNVPGRYGVIVVSLLAAVAVFMFLSRRREQIARLSSMLVEVNLPVDPLGMTLFHMGEIYARKYKCPSLVETIRSWDMMLKYVFIYMYYGTFGLYFFSFKDSLIWTLAGCVVGMSVYQAYYLLRKN
ncbi:MAG: hypothetical protein V2A70_09165 [Candidatus Omnitrophota bacterium]